MDVSKEILDGGWHQIAWGMTLGMLAYALIPWEKIFRPATYEETVRWIAKQVAKRHGVKIVDNEWDGWSPSISTGLMGDYRERRDPNFRILTNKAEPGELWDQDSRP